ncbi:chemotaxis protein CheW [bacterium]|nr:chemotaxis protein CheW [bacterium]
MDLERTAVVERSVQLVVFALGEEEYGLPIQYVKEIIRKPDITQLPNAPEFILGVINLRGQVIPILSLHERFNLGRLEDEETKVVIIDYGGLLIGMEVSEVSEVLTLDSERISPAPRMATSIDSAFIEGVGKLEDRLLIILDVERILSDEEAAMLRAQTDAVTSQSAA